MKKNLRFVFFIAIITCSGIVIFQFYWLYNAFSIAENNFYKTATSALQRSIDAYQIAQTGLFNTSPGNNKISIFMDSSAFQNNATVKATIPVAVTSNIRQMVQVVMSRLFLQVANKPVPLKEVQKKYRQELDKVNIHLPFTLSVIESKSNYPAHAVIGNIGFSESSKLIEAHFDRTSLFLIWQNVMPVLVSLLLILLTAGCLWYMWHIIKKQVRLDVIKNDFINNMTHELRTPLAILKSTHEALDTFGGVADHEKTIRYLRINGVILQKLEDNINRILDITRYETGAKFAKSENVSLKELMNEVIQRFSNVEQASVSLHYDMEEQTINTDRYIIDTIVSNLVDNALKYAGGEAAIIVKVSSAGDCWLLQVIDNGPGIDERYLPFLFDKFYRVPTGNLHDTKGFGLGLHYVKELADILKGKVSVQSKQHEGTTFTLQFPFIWKK